MEKTIWDLRYFGEAGENGGAAENGNGLPGKTAEDAQGKAGQAEAASGADGGKAGEPKKDAAVEKQKAGADGGKPEEGTGNGKPGRPDRDAAEGTDGKETEEEAPDDGTLLRKAALAARLRAAEQTARRWEREAESLKEVYPDFSLEKALRGDAGFTALLKAGAPVKLAYEAAHLEEILGAAMRYAAKSAGRRMAQTMAADAGRERENPVLDRAASVTKKDVASLTEKEIMKILRQVSRGEKVVF